MNTSVKALSNEELEIISGGTVEGEAFKKGFIKGFKISWKVIKIIGVIGGICFFRYWFEI